MDNVFDLVEGFYIQDPEWNNVLRQKYAEDFLRLKSWQGAKDEELLKIWDYMTELLLYLGNADNFLGDMNREDFIDCVGWCCRNIADFTPTVKYVDGFLTTIGELFTHLKKKHIIMYDSAPLEAKAKLIADGKLQIIGEDGAFLPKFDRYNQYATPDLPSKIYLNIGERIQNLLNFLQQYYGEKKYARDIERANFLFGGVLFNDALKEQQSQEEYMQTFWDYFLFDYHMLGNDKTPLQNFYDKFKVDSFSTEGMPAKDIVQELLKAKLALFEVQEKTPEGMYSCRDLLTGEQYTLMMPIDEDARTEGFVFMGHIFYDNTMVMNFVRGMLMNRASRKRFLQVLEQAKNWFAIRYGGDMSWDDFVRRNPIFVRHISLLYAAYIRMEGFNYETQVANYKAQPTLNDSASMMIWDMMRHCAFSAYDILLAKTMWSDYVHKSGKIPDTVELPEIWAAGIVYNFIKANSVYNYDMKQISAMCYGLNVNIIQRTAKEIASELALEKHDPRYVNEEGLLLMLLQ